MTISYLIHSLREAGTTVQAINYCKGAAKAGTDITLVTLFEGGAFNQTNIGFDTVLCLGKPSKFETLVGIVRLMKYIRRERPDVIISGAKRINMWAIIAKLMSFGRTKLIVTLTNDLEQKTAAKPKGRFIKSAILRWFYQAADMTLVLTPQMRSKLIAQNFPEHKITYAPPPINLDEVRQRSQFEIDHPWLRGKKSDRAIPVIVATGRLSLQKNYPLLLRAFAVASKRTPLRLIILGTGSAVKTAEIKALIMALDISGSVDLIGFKPNPYPYFAQADIFALSSNWEGFGIVLLEALACGTTIVSTRCPTGPEDILEDGAFGFLSRPDDIEGFANNILQALEHPMAAAALMARADVFGIDKSIARYQNAINAVERQN